MDRCTTFGWSDIQQQICVHKLEEIILEAVSVTQILDFSDAILWTVTVLPVFARVMRRFVVRVMVENIARTTESGAEGSVNYLSVVADSACDVVTDTEQQQSCHNVYFKPKSLNFNNIYANLIKNKYSWIMSSYNEIVSNPRGKNVQTKEGKHKNLCK